MPSPQFRRRKGFVGSSRVFERIQGASFPMLESITEFHDRRHYGDTFHNDRMSYSSSWNIPMLRTLVLQDCLPHSLPSLANVTTFDANFSSSGDLGCMLGILLGMKSLSSFRIDVPGIGNFDMENMAKLSAPENTVLGTVKKLTVCYALSHSMKANSNDFQCLHAVLSKLYFPNTTDATFEGSTGRTDFDSSKRLVLLHLLLRCISDQGRFPKAVICTIVVDRGTSQASTPQPTPFPMHFSDGLEHLRFTCNTPLSFSEKDVTKVEPTLRTLTLGINPDPNYDTSATMRWVRWIIGCLRRQGGWGTFRELQLLKQVHRNVYEYEYEYKTSVPQDETLAWCKSDHVFSGIRRRSQSIEYEYESDWS